MECSAGLLEGFFPVTDARHPPFKVEVGILRSPVSRDPFQDLPHGLENLLGFFLDSSMDSFWILLGFFLDSLVFFLDPSWILLGSFLDSSRILLGFFYGFFLDPSWILLGSFLDSS